MRKAILLRHVPLHLNAFIILVFLSIFPISENPLKAQTSNEEDEVVLDNHSHNDIQRGERFFKGLLPKDRKYESCESCHILTKSDTMNWNPSAMDIATKYAGKDFSEFQSVVMQPNGTKMEASHKNFQIEEQDLKKVKLYLDELAQTGPHDQANNQSDHDLSALSSADDLVFA